MNIIPHILAQLTGDRYLPEIQWARNNWTHNFFRLYEIIFWKKAGLTREWAIIDNKLHLFTVEARIAHIEGIVRQYIRSFKVEKVPVPCLNIAGVARVNILPFPYLYAISRDTNNADSGATSSSRTQTLTCSGSDRILLGFPYHDTGGLSISAFTYDSVSMGAAVGTTTTANGSFYSYALVAPNTTAGASLSVTLGGSTYVFINAISYTGALQTGQPDAHNETSDAASGASISTSVTTVASKCWIAGASRHDNVGTISGTNSFTLVAQSGANGTAVLDTNGVIDPAGATTVGSSSTSNGGRYLVAVSVAPKPVVTDARFARRILRPAIFSPGRAR